MEETHENNFKEYLILKAYATKTSAPITEVRKLSDRALRAHLMTVHGDGHSLSEITDYLTAFHSISVTPQQLKKIFKLSSVEEWQTAAEAYRQHRHDKLQQRAISNLG